MRLTLLSAVAAVALVAACGGGGGDEDAPPATVTVTSSGPADTLSPAQQALQDSACNNYEDAVDQSIQENRRLSRGKTDPVLIMSVIWDAGADKVAALQAPSGTDLEGALDDVRKALTALRTKADNYDPAGRGVLDIAYELRAFRLSDRAVRALCAG